MRALCFSFLPLLLGGCTMIGEASETRDFPVGAFSAIDIVGTYEVAISPGPRAAIRAEGDAKALDALRIRVVDGELTIRKRSRGMWGMGWMFGQDDRPATLYVTAPSLSRVTASGAGEIDIKGVTGDRLAVLLSGASDVRVSGLDVRSSEFVAAGAGSLTLSGRADQSRMSVSGAGDVDAAGLETRILEVSVAGAGDVEARASESARVSVAGIGDVRVRGTASCAVSRMGIGKVECGA